MACPELVVCWSLNCGELTDCVHCISGRHCCLWCHIASADLRIPLSVRGRLPERTLATLQRDHSNFMADGGDITKAKFFNNAIAPVLLDIPLDRVQAALYKTWLNTNVTHHRFASPDSTCPLEFSTGSGLYLRKHAQK